jgi:predicted MPP superfamily phosphohydrolase
MSWTENLGYRISKLVDIHILNIVKLNKDLELLKVVDDFNSDVVFTIVDSLINLVYLYFAYVTV